MLTVASPEARGIKAREVTGHRATGVHKAVISRKLQGKHRQQMRQHSLYRAKSLRETGRSRIRARTSNARISRNARKASRVGGNRKVIISNKLTRHHRLQRMGNHNNHPGNSQSNSALRALTGHNSQGRNVATGHHRTNRHNNIKIEKPPMRWLFNLNVGRVYIS